MLKNCIATENKKLRGSKIWLVFLLVPVLPAVLGTLNYLGNIQVLKNGWYDLWSQHTLFYVSFFFAPLTAIYCSYIWRLEHLGHNWNLIMTMPAPRIYFFLGKMAAVLKMVCLTQLWCLMLFSLSGKAAHLKGIMPSQFILWSLLGILGSLPVIAIQLLFSMWIRSFAVPVFMALGGSIIGLLLNANGMGLIFPYSLMMSGMNANQSSASLSLETGKYIISCIGFTLIFTAIGKISLNRRDIHAV